MFVDTNGNKQTEHFMPGDLDRFASNLVKHDIEQSL